MNQGHMDHTEPVTEAHRGDDPRAPGYETRDANVNGLLRFGLGLIVALTVTQLLMLGLYRVFERMKPPVPTLRTTENLYQQLRDLRTAEDVTLSSYRIDPETGVVRIPIERAMEVVAEKGSPFGKGPKTELEMNSHGGTPVPAGGGDAPRPSGGGKAEAEAAPAPAGAERGSKP